MSNASDRSSGSARALTTRDQSLLLGPLARGSSGMAWGGEGNSGGWGSGARGVREGRSKVSRGPGVRATEASSRWVVTSRAGGDTGEGS